MRIINFICSLLFILSLRSLGYFFPIILTRIFSIPSCLSLHNRCHLLIWMWCSILCDAVSKYCKAFVLLSFKRETYFDAFLSLCRIFLCLSQRTHFAFKLFFSSSEKKTVNNKCNKLSFYENNTQLFGTLILQRHELIPPHVILHCIRGFLWCLSSDKCLSCILGEITFIQVNFL